VLCNVSIPIDGSQSTGPVTGASSTSKRHGCELLFECIIIDKFIVIIQCNGDYVWKDPTLIYKLL
jgi:hypothetical protein